MSSETQMALIWIGIWLIGLLYSEQKNWAPGLWVTKPFASMGLFVLALTLITPAVDSTQKTLLLSAIAFCIVGDVLLISLSEKLFLLGIGSFALGHVGYLATFVVRAKDMETRPILFALPMTVIVSFFITRYLWNKIPQMLRPAVLGYVVLISGLVTAAWRVSEGPGGTLLILGAVAFYVSDISVALDRFVQRKFIYRLWGLPLYYAAQALLIFGLAA